MSQLVLFDISKASARAKGQATRFSGQSRPGKKHRISRDPTKHRRRARCCTTPIQKEDLLKGSSCRAPESELDNVPWGNSPLSIPIDGSLVASEISGDLLNTNNSGHTKVMGCYMAARVLYNEASVDTLDNPLLGTYFTADKGRMVSNRADNTPRDVRTVTIDIVLNRFTAIHAMISGRLTYSIEALSNRAAFENSELMHCSSGDALRANMIECANSLKDLADSLQEKANIGGNGQPLSYRKLSDCGLLADCLNSSRCFHFREGDSSIYLASPGDETQSFDTAMLGLSDFQISLQLKLSF